MSKSKIINKLKNKKIGIWGLGREGTSTLYFLEENNITSNIYLYDTYLNYPENNIYPICNSLEELNTCDLIFKSPGIILNDIVDKEKLTSQTNLFLDAFRDQVIGVTGTKGKSTTTSLLYKVLKDYIDSVIFVGNIGIPSFDCINQITGNTIIVYEIGVHQLEIVKTSPHIGVLLNIYEEHLDHYGNYQTYENVKRNIYKFQTEKDYLICNKEIAIKQLSSKLIQVGSRGDIEIDGRNIITPKESIKIEEKDTKLVGEHNFYNISIVYYICHHLFGISSTDFKKSLKNFEGLPHRLEFVGEYDHIYYYNDSISTVAETTINAVKALKTVDTIILGGLDRGISYDKLVDYLIITDISNILLLPDTNIRIKELFDARKHTKNIVMLNQLSEAVSLAKQITQKNKICLLSPAAASYGRYKNFEERGEEFKQLILDLK